MTTWFEGCQVVTSQSNSYLRQDKLLCSLTQSIIHLIKHLSVILIQGGI